MSYIGWSILLVCFFSVVSLFFSVCAISLSDFSRAKLVDILRDRNRETLADRIFENNERLFLTCAFYRIITNICILLLLLFLFTNDGKGRGKYSDYIAVFITASVIYSVFSLAIPHAWAKYSGEKILSYAYIILFPAVKLTWPVLYIFQWYDRFVRRLAGVVKSSPEKKQEEKQEEFLTDLEQHKIEGTVDEEEQEMIENVLELNETTADEIITPRTDIVAFEAGSDLSIILKTIKKAGHSRYPVYKENIDNIIGFVYAKDLLTEIGKPAENFKLENKIREAYFVPKTKSLRALLHEFQNQKLHIAVVLDEYGGTVGIVTLEDIIEELVGEIADEYEEFPPEPIKEIDKNTLEVDARTYIDDLNDQFELNLPEEEDYDTIAGFVLLHLGYIPKINETFDYKNLEFTIVSAEARKIKRIRIQKTNNKNAN